MKKVFQIIFILSFFVSFGQESKDFIVSDKYYATEIDSVISNKYWKDMVSGKELPLVPVYIKEKNGKEIYSFNVEELDSYSRTEIEILNDPGLENITQIIHIKIDYNACCSSYLSINLLKTKNGKLIKLPESDYLHCDGPTPIIEYRFPAQKFGLNNKIILTESSRDENYKVASVNVLKTYNWNGKIFELEE